MLLIVECWIRLLDVTVPGICLSLCRITLKSIIEALFISIMCGVMKTLLAELQSKLEI